MSIKKVIVSLFLCFFMLIFVSCDEKKEILLGSEYIFGQDHAISNMADLGNKVMETADGYIYCSSRNSQLQYIEKKTMKEIPLCGKPSCLHEDASCNAYLDTTVTNGLFYCQDVFYGIEKKVIGADMFPTPVLTEFSLDGSKRKEIWKITWDEEIIQGGLSFSVLHRGNFYFLVSGEQDQSAIFCYNIEQKKCSLVTFTEEYVFDLKGIGDYLYWYQENSESGVQSIVQYHTVTGEITKQWENRTCVTANSEHIYMLQINESQTALEVLQLDRDGTNEVATGLEIVGTIIVDNTYLYHYNQLDQNKVLDIYEISTWKKIDTIDMPTSGIIADIVPCDDDHVFLYSNAANVECYFKKSAIGTPDFQWYEVEKVN